jgi:hypothetical protein
VHGDGLADDEAIFDELADGLARVGASDFSLLTWVEPDLALAAADDCFMLLELATFSMYRNCVRSHILRPSMRTSVRFGCVGTDLRRRGASACED